jgi:hypothetical protein
MAYAALVTLAILVAAAVVIIGGYWNSKTTCTTEPFAGLIAGAGTPDCLRSSSEAAELYALLASKTQTTEEGPDDLHEMTLILSKMACFKRDLTGGAAVVSATYQQPFSTAHDIEPIAETTARCFARTLSQRDLSLSLEKWSTRGRVLISRICTSVQLSDKEEKEAMDLFTALMTDISNISLNVCCERAEAIIAGQSVSSRYGGYSPPELVRFGEYKGYY